MKRVVYLLYIIALFPLMAMGQSYVQKEKPFWADGYFREMENSYLEVVYAFDYDLKSARNRAVKEVISRRSMATGTSASVSMQNNDISVTSGHELIVKARVIDEYFIHTNTGYTVYLLVQTAKNPTFTYEQVSISDEYGFSFASLVPGMAQIKKGSTVKGLSIIAAEAIAVGGIIVCENQRATYESKMRSQPNFAKQYKTKVDNYETARNCCIGAAAAIYIYNLIDAIVAPGASRVVVKSRNMHFTPMASKDFSGVTFSYNF